ncbi:MAG: adenosylmethionine--8-amino-7-oxononanoate transaminase [Lacipirellulaceae bacterium]
MHQLHDWDREHYWHSFTPMAGYEPLVIAHARGSTLVDVEGRELLDAASSMWCAALGHRHPRVTAAIAAQLDRVAHCTSLGMGADVAVRLAKRLADLAPGDLRHVFYASDGASAIEIAMKQAFQFWRQCDTPRTTKVPLSHRTKFLALEGAYHGDTIGALAVGGIGRYQSVFGPLLCEVERVPPPDTRSLVDGGRDLVAEALENVEAKFRGRAHEFAAVVVEPLVQCSAGMLMHAPGFLAGLRSLCDEYDVLLIADEVAVGVGRTGRMFACDQEGVAPDFLCLGKQLTAGYLPMAATLTTPRVYQAFLNRSPDEDRTFWHGHTFGGNALAAAAALATLDELEEHVLPQLPATIAHMAERLARLAELPGVLHPRQRGMIAAIDLVDSGSFLDESSRGRRVARYALEHGVWLRARAGLVYLMPPLNVSVEDLDRMFDVVEGGLLAQVGRGQQAAGRND